MQFYKELYVGNSIQHVKRIRWKLAHRAGLYNVFVISINEGTDQLDIIDSKFLKQPHWDIDSMLVVGLAGSYGEAVELVQRMLNDTYKKQQNADIKSYLLQTMMDGRN